MHGESEDEERRGEERRGGGGGEGGGGHLFSVGSTNGFRHFALVPWCIDLSLVLFDGGAEAFLLLGQPLDLLLEIDDAREVHQ